MSGELVNINKHQATAAYCGRIKDLFVCLLYTILFKSSFIMYFKLFPYILQQCCNDPFTLNSFLRKTKGYGMCFGVFCFNILKDVISLNSPKY